MSHKKIWVPFLWLLLWQLAAMAVDEELLLPAPLPVLSRMIKLPLQSAFWLTCGHSLGRILLGFLLGVAAGCLLAVLSAFFPPIQAFLSPAMAAIKATPVASFVILALVWIRGVNLSIFISFLMVLPLVWQNVSQGIAAADPALLEMAAVFRLSFVAKAKAIYLPAVLPYLLSALRVGLGFAWKAGIAGEVIAIAPRSIGLELYQAKVSLEMPDLFAWTGFIILLSVALERAMVALLSALSRPKEKEG